MAFKSQKKGFVYKPRTADQVKARAVKFTSNFDSIFKPGFDSFRPKNGDNLIRYLPPTWDDNDHYCLTVWEHRWVGSKNGNYLCLYKMLNKRCPFCEAEREAKDAGEGDEAKSLAPKERAIAWVLDRDADDPEKPLLFDNSRPEDSNIACLCVNDRTGEILMIDHPDTGYDVSFKRKKGVGKAFNVDYYGHQIARHASPICDNQRTQDEILDFIEKNPVPECLRYYDYEYLKGMLSGTVAETDMALDTEEEEPPFDTKARGPRRDQEPEEESELKPVRKSTRPSLADMDDEEAAPVRTARVRARPEPEPMDEEIDEEAEEVEPMPRQRQTASQSPRNDRQRVLEEVEDEAPSPQPRTTRTVSRR